ncbi:hypothetical protein U1Q18_052847 [Sarracenia purpurea var. burkii]
MRFKLTNLSIAKSQSRAVAFSSLVVSRSSDCVQLFFQFE